MLHKPQLNPAGEGGLEALASGSCTGATGAPILLIDDTPAIHDDFRKILCAPADLALDGVEQVLFGSTRAAPNRFQLDSEYQGLQGVRRVQEALEAGIPYAVAIVDMRMPPGIDGMETVERLWQLDPRLQIVICTAYSDHAWGELLDRLDVRDRLLVLKKPFEVIEVSQLVHALATKWRLAREAEQHARQMEETVRQLRRSEAQLRCTARELEAFAYSLSHDLQSPLARIGAFGELLAEQLPQAEGKARHYLDRIRANAAVGQDVISSLQTLNRIAQTSLQCEDADLSQLASGLLAELQESEPSREVSVRVQPGLRAWADPRLLRIVLSNLLDNAWKFTSRRQCAEIEFGAGQGTPELRAFFVRDNGCGFDMSHCTRLFQDFRRLHPPDEYPGTGVGLVTAGRILARHGGRIRAESAPGQGCTFTFALPVRPASAEAALASQNFP